MITFGSLSYVRIRIEGEELPDSIVLEVVSVRSDVSLSLPSFSVSIRDTGSFLVNRVVEGAKIEILVAQKKENNADWIPFRIFSFSHSYVNRAGSTYKIHGYYDYKDFLYSRVVRSFEGTSSSIIEELAKDGGLELYSDPTTETDTNWYCARQTLADFIRNDVVPAATAGDESLIMSVIDARTRAWCYKDIAKVASGQPLSKLINSSVVNEKEYDAMMLQHKYENASGFNNMLGYSLRNARYDAATDEHTDENEVKIAKSNPKLSMNKNIPENSYVMYAPMDFGNNGKGAKNRGVNIRQRAVWSMNMAVLIGTYSPFPLLTVHQLDIFNGDKAADARLSGKYVCTGRTIAATPTSYREALTLIRNSEVVENSEVVS